MLKEEEIDVLSTALSKLKSIKSKRYNSRTLEDIDWVFKVILKSIYGVKKELTCSEIIDHIHKRHIKEDEKEALIGLLEVLEYIKYQIKEPKPKDAKIFLGALMEFIKFKIEKVKNNG
jgi:hypothetical protein